MYIAVIVDSKLLEIKEKIDRSKKKESKEEESQEIEEIDEEDVAKIFPLTVLQQALDEYDNQVEFLAPTEKLFSLLSIGKFDLIINSMQNNASPNIPAQFIGLFDIVNIPFVGSPMDSVSLCKNKALFKSILQLNQIATPRFQIMKILPGKTIQLNKKLRFPLVIKLFSESTHDRGIHDRVVENHSEFEATIAEFSKKTLHSYVMAEELILGQKIYIPILGNDLTENIHYLPAIEYKYPDSVKPNAFVSVSNSELEKKFLDMTDPIVQRARKVAHKAYLFCNCRDYAMVVFFIDHSTGNLLLHELNPITSLLPGSKIVQSAEHVGISYTELINDLIMNAMLRYDMKIRGKYSKRLKNVKK